MTPFLVHYASDIVKIFHRYDFLPLLGTKAKIGTTCHFHYSKIFKKAVFLNSVKAYYLSLNAASKKLDKLINK